MLHLPDRVSFPHGLRVRLSSRDRAILELTRQKLAGVAVDFGTAAAALGEATEELIPSGRVYLLGDGRVVGSLVSGIGIAKVAHTIAVVQVDRAGARTIVGRLIR